MKRCPFSFPFSIISLKGVMHIFSYHTKGTAVLYIEEQASHWWRRVCRLLSHLSAWENTGCVFLIETAEKIGWVYHVRFIHCVSGRGVCFHAVHQNPLQTFSWIMQRLRWKYSLGHPPPPSRRMNLWGICISASYFGSQVILQIWVLGMPGYTCTRIVFIVFFFLDSTHYFHMQYWKVMAWWDTKGAKYKVHTI